jgi:hypothetical protein
VFLDIFVGSLISNYQKGMKHAKTDNKKRKLNINHGILTPKHSIAIIMLSGFYFRVKFRASVPLMNYWLTLVSIII